MVSALFKKKSPDDMGTALRDGLTEFVATGLFVYFGTLSVAACAKKGALSEFENLYAVISLFPIAFAFGISITVLVYSIGHVTGGHMNPGVSLLMYFKREMSLWKMLIYMVCQGLGAMIGSAMVLGTAQSIVQSNGGTYNLGQNSLSSTTSVGSAFLVEIVGSFMFYFVIAQTALDKKGVAKTSFPPLPIGLSLVVVHICLIPFTGCGINPARTFGPSMVSIMTGYPVAGSRGYWVYYIAPFSASFLVAEFTNFLESAQEPCEPCERVAPTPDNEEPLLSGSDEVA
mmetsp:Transcript_34157/g.50191  ORF Transcript_34157/g.50191 Transcript_34157/m.50191 type:complete len:286 (-) Transcript_34157:204-1061(-)